MSKIVASLWKARFLARPDQQLDRHIQAAKVAVSYLVLKLVVTVLLRYTGMTPFWSEFFATGTLGVFLVGYLSYLVFSLYDKVEDIKGETGATGATGATGEQGERGERGERGEPGERA